MIVVGEVVVIVIDKVLGFPLSPVFVVAFEELALFNGEGGDANP